MTIQISLAPTAPSRADPENFAERGDAFMSYIEGLPAQLNAQNAENNTLATAILSGVMESPVVTVGGSVPPETDDGKDKGVIARWHNGTSSKFAFFGFDRSTGKLVFIPDAVGSGGVYSGVVGSLDAKLTVSNLVGTLDVIQGGTGKSTYLPGGLVFASSASSLDQIASTVAGSVLLSAGSGSSPVYGKVGLTTHVSGTLPVSSGGTGSTDAAGARTALGLTIGTDVQSQIAQGTAAQYYRGDKTWQNLTFSVLGSTPTTLQGYGITSGYISGQVSLGGVTGSESLRVTPITNAVNYLQIAGGSAASWPVLSNQGSEADVGITYSAKGVSGHTFYTGNGTANSFFVGHATNATNYVKVVGGPTSNPTQISSAGADTTVPVAYMAKGTSAHNFYTNGTIQFQLYHTNSTVNYVAITGSPTGIGVGVTPSGADVNINNGMTSKGTGGISFSANSWGTPTLYISHTANGVNFAQFWAGTTGGGYTLSAQGADTNISPYYLAKGTGSHIFGATGGIQFSIGNTASAVNYLAVTGGSAGNSPSESSLGTDTNISKSYYTKGTGEHYFNTNGVVQCIIGNVTNAVNFLKLTGAVTGGTPTVAARGSDSNVDLLLSPKGTGKLYTQYNNVNYLVLSALDIGTEANQIPLNGSLGSLAFMGKESIVISPQASASPLGKGDMVFELTSDTQLKIKVKGSDGTVRSTSLTLA